MIVYDNTILRKRGKVTTLQIHELSYKPDDIQVESKLGLIRCEVLAFSYHPKSRWASILVRVGR